MLELHIPQHATGALRRRFVKDLWGSTKKSHRPLFRLALYREALGRMEELHGAGAVKEALSKESLPNCIVCLCTRTGNDGADRRPIMHCGVYECARLLRYALMAEEDARAERQRILAAMVEAGRAAA